MGIKKGIFMRYFFHATKICNVPLLRVLVHDQDVAISFMDSIIDNLDFIPNLSFEAMKIL